MKVRNWRVLSVAVTTALVMTGCGASNDSDGNSSAKDKIIIAIPTEPDTLDAQAVNDRSSRAVTFSIYEGLLFRGADGKIENRLATSYKPLGDTSWQIELRTGVKFHNGEPFDAKAAAASINRIVNPKYTTQRGSYIEKIKSAEATGENTIVIHTDGLDAILPAQLTSIPMVPADADAIDIGQKPIGTGPYKFNTWNRGQNILLDRSDTYWGEKGKLAHVELRIVPDKQTAVSALQAGEVNLVLDLLPEDTSLVPQKMSVPGIDFSYIAFNTFKKELSSPLVRQALNYAVNKDELAKTLYQGYATPNESQNLTSAMLGFNKDIKAFPYDPDKARALLAEAGYANGFKLTLNVPIGRYLKGEESADYIANQLKQVGVDVTVRKWEWNQYRDAGRIAGDKPNAFDLKYGWNSNEWFDAARIVEHVICGGSSSKYCDPKVDQAWEDAAKTTDQDERAALYQAGWAELHENPYSIYLLQQDYIYGMSKDLKWSPQRQDDELDFSTMSFS